MIIQHYAKNRLYKLDEITGKVKKILMTVDDKNIRRGSIYKSKWEWFAIYEDKGMQVLQKGCQKWLIDHSHNISVKGDLLREFSITKDGKTIFQHKYIAPMGAWICSHIDPTYDLIDAESDDFFILVAGRLDRSNIETPPFTKY